MPTAKPATATNMTTFLEFVLTQYHGKPNGTGSEVGVSYWNCPMCGHDSFHTLPDKPQFTHRAKCHNSACRFIGDAADVLKPFHPDWSDRKLRLEQLQREWQAQNRAPVLGRGVQKRGSHAK